MDGPALLQDTYFNDDEPMEVVAVAIPPPPPAAGMHFILENSEKCF
jgi:hypothetical protein